MVDAEEGVGYEGPVRSIGGGGSMDRGGGIACCRSCARYMIVQAWAVTAKPSFLTSFKTPTYKL